jgi:hypothetical protein
MRTLPSFLTRVFVVSLFYPAMSYATGGAPSWIGIDEVDRIVNVDNTNSKSSDKNPGTSDLPLKTITAAAQLAMNNRIGGFSTRILINPGVYREQVKISSPNPRKDVSIIFEAKEPGKTIMSGSDIWTDWAVKAEHIYVHPWPYKWGLAPYPAGWEGHVKLDPIVRRREMVFINGAPLDQALSFSGLRANSFFISEDTRELFVYPPPGLNLPDARVEVAIRSELFLVTSINNVVLRGIVFQHDTTPLQGSAVQFSNSQGILIEDCEFFLNSWTGLGLNNVSDVTVRRSLANRNGGSGWTAWRVSNMLSESNETSFNNWRGERGGFLGWAVAGVKHLQIHDALYRNHTAKGNRTRGIWFDFDNTNVILNGLNVCDNLGDGIDIEASQGPITIKESRIYNNSGNGIFSTNSHRIRIEGGFIHGNKISQIKLSGKPEREIRDWQTKQAITLRADQWELRNNIIKGSSNRVLLDVIGWPNFLNNFVSDGNVWIGKDSEKVFKVGQSLLSFLEWQELTKQELHSNFRNSELTSVSEFSNSCSKTVAG